MKTHNFEQQTPEWFAIRQKKLTASHAQAIASAGKGLDTYVSELMSDYYSSGENENYTNKDMERGNELEPLARTMYELETGNELDEVGFVEVDEYSGFSPDGLYKEVGGVEVKSLNDKNHFQVILNGLKAVDKKDIWQIQMSLLLSKRVWWDLILYNPNFKKSLLIFRIEPDKEMQDKLLIGIEKGKEMIKEIEKKIAT